MTYAAFALSTLCLLTYDASAATSIFKENDSIKFSITNIKNKALGSKDVKFIFFETQ